MNSCLPGFAFARKLPALAALLITLAASAQPALAHDDEPPTPHDLWSVWNWEPAILLGLALGVWVYLHGLRILWRYVARGRAARRWKKALALRAASFLTGLIILGLALLSPLDALGLALFSAHMSQHTVLILVAAPLLVLGDPLTPFILIFPTPVRRAMGRWWNHATLLRLVWRVFTQPSTVWALHTFALWAWHAPGPYQAALQSDLIHTLEHASFLGTALLFWWVIASSASGRLPKARGLGRGLAVVYLFTTALQSGVLGALITFAPTPWYAAYALTTSAWHLSLLEDQQLAGAIMWIPSGVVYLLAAMNNFMALLAGVEHETHQREIQVRVL